MRLGVTQFEKPRSSVGCIEQHDPAKRDQIDTSSKRETTRHRRVGASRLVKWHVLMPQGGSRRSDRSALGAAVRSWTNCAPGRTARLDGLNQSKVRSRLRRRRAASAIFLRFLIEGFM